MSTQITPVYEAPVIPGKYDIIPVHNSDRANFKRCRRYFDWTSPARQSLMMNPSIYGVNTDLWFGTGIHYALEQFYTPGLKRDPVETWKTWFDIQWRGGVVSAEWLELVYDLKPVAQHTTYSAVGNINFTGEQMYQVRGLMNIIPDPDVQKFNELLELGVAMMKFYKDYAARNDAFDILCTEHTFSIPVWDYENDCILTAVDVREQSPNCGKRLEVHSRGRLDALYAKPSGRIGIMDHKTSSRIDEEFFEKLENDEQVTNYLYAAQVEAKYYGMPWANEVMEECIYNVLYKKSPQPPTIVRGGLFSINRADESCTYNMLMEWIKDNGFSNITLSEKHQAYIDYLRDVGDDQFIVRKFPRRNQAQLRSAGYRTYLEAMDMLQPNLRIYPTISNDWLCLKCAFRAPCLATDDGSDAQSMIDNGFTRNRDR